MADKKSTASPFSPEGMRARFHELNAQKAAIEAEVAPLEKRRDELTAGHQAVMRPLSAEIKEKRAPLFEIDQERARLVRALNGKTGAPPTAA